MKKVILYLVVLSTPLYSDISHVSGFLNDNYTGGRENGENGLYIGCDDFLTFGLFSKTEYDSLKLSYLWQIITSRKYKYRYDVIEFNLEYQFNYNNLRIIPLIGYIQKGNFGGEIFQNDFHKLRDIPSLFLNYDTEDFGIITGISAKYNIKNYQFYYSLYLPFKIRSINSTLSISYIKTIDRVTLDFNLGYKHQHNYIEKYSNFLRNGFLGGGQIIWNIYNNFCINAGVFIFPARNLNIDPTYLQREYSLSPQFWVGIGYNGNKYKIVDIVNR